MAIRILCILLLSSTLTNLLGQSPQNWRMLLSETGKVVDLRGKNLKQVPVESLDIHVEVLLLDDNDIREFPLFLPTYCPRLKVLSMNNNCLHEIPDRLGHSTGLEELHLDGNEIEALPFSIIGLRSLKMLSLNQNRIHSLVNILKNLPSLEALYVDNNLIRHIPEEIGALTNFVALSASDNLLESVSKELGQCEKLRHLELSYNPSLTSIPEDLRRCSALRTLDLKRTNVSGKLEWTIELPDLDSYRSSNKGVTKTKRP